jgi:hypothetical protein
MTMIIQTFGVPAALSTHFVIEFRRTESTWMIVKTVREMSCAKAEREEGCPPSTRDCAGQLAALFAMSEGRC